MKKDRKNIKKRKKVEKSRKMFYNRKVTKNSLYIVGGTMVTIIASGIKDPNKKQELIEFCKQNNSEVLDTEDHGLKIQCPDLKTAKIFDEKIRKLKG